MLALPLPALAQTQTAPPQDQGPAIVVQGSLEKMSDWRVAETDHVIVYSQGPQSELIKIAHNLERLHFLLSLIMNRVDQPDDTIKLRVTLVDDAAEFDAMDLRNVRSRQGPFASAFQYQRYYDPREDGAVLAGGRADARVEIERSQRVDLASLGGGGTLNPQTGQVESTQFSAGTNAPSVVTGTPPITVSGDGRIYAGFAQHFLLTYFPAAYPRWYLDGFGELFSTIRIGREDGAIEYGHMPDGYRRVIEAFGNVPVKDVITGRYVDVARQKRWTPFHAWILTHFMLFNETRRPQFSKYLLAIGHGATLEQASTVFGDLGKLEAEVKSYDNRRLQYERMTYPPERAAEPVVSQLNRGQAEFLKGRIELGSRVEIPAGAQPGMDAKTAERAASLRKEALADRDRWLRRLRGRAGDYANNLDAQVLLAEAECRSGNSAECLAVATAALRINPGDARALSWKGVALTQQAIAGPADQRAAALRTARTYISRANRADTDSTLPLIAYYRSYADAGEAPPEVATVGLLKAVDSVPASTSTRLALGEELARQGHGDAARKILEPVAHGPYDSPERARAVAILEGLPAK